MDARPFPVNVYAWFTDPFVRGLEPATRAFYFDMLVLSWKEEGIRAAWIENPTGICGVFHIHRKSFFAAWKKVSEKFYLDADGRWRNAVVERVRKGLAGTRAGGEVEKSRRRAGEEQEKSTSSRNLVPSKYPKGHKANAPTRAGARSLSLFCEEEDQIEEEKREDPHREFVRYFEQAWISEMKPLDGRPPKLQKPDILALRALLDEYGPRSQFLVDRFLKDRDPFLVRNGHSPKYLTSRINAYRSTATPQEGKPSDRPKPRSYQEVMAEEEETARRFSEENARRLAEEEAADDR